MNHVQTRPLVPPLSWAVVEPHALETTTLRGTGRVFPEGEMDENMGSLLFKSHKNPEKNP